ncbi:MAG: O-antigen ligase family protein, partial [Chlorobium sp.]|nr:O-antigen ligase family protein [Chlorobium sp.]
TGSRAGFLATFVIAMLVLLHNYKKLKPTFFSFPKPKKIALMILLCIVAASFAPSYYWERINTLKSGKEVGQSKSLYSRTILLERGLQVWMENPLLGVGLGNFGQAFIQGGGKKQLYKGPSKEAVAHNMYLELLVETGLIGCLLFLSISLVSLVGFFRIDSSRYNGGSYKSMGYGFTVSLLSMLLFGLTLSQGYNSILWYLLGMGMAAIRINKINNYSAKFLLTDNPAT